MTHLKQRLNSEECIIRIPAKERMVESISEVNSHVWRGNCDILLRKCHKHSILIAFNMAAPVTILTEGNNNTYFKSTRELIHKFASVT